MTKTETLSYLHKIRQSVARAESALQQDDPGSLREEMQECIRVASKIEGGIR